MNWKDVCDGQEGETFIVDNYPKTYTVKPRSGKFKLNMNKDGRYLQVGLPCTKPWYGFKQYNTSCMFSL